VNNKDITIITPTTGKNSLFRAIESLEKQDVLYEHILLWDDKLEGDFLYPNSEMRVKQPEDIASDSRFSIIIPGNMVQGRASGSALRSVGLMVAKTPYVIFMDDDVWYEKEHLKNMLALVKGRSWAYCRRKIWASEKEYIGVDNFESVGDDPSRKVPYEMVDNNCMIFSRRFGTSGAVLYRETCDYNDDRLYYAFLKKYAGEPGKTNNATVNQICPERLIPMFKEHCTRET